MILSLIILININITTIINKGNMYVLKISKGALCVSSSSINKSGLLDT